jgi:predicted ATPase
MGEFASAWAEVEQGLTFYDPQVHHSLTLHYGIDPTMICNCIAGLSLWHLGYPDQALRRIRQALTFSQELVHPMTLVAALQFAAFLHQLRREGQLAQEWAEAALTLATDQGFPMFLALGAIFRGWALAERSSQATEGGEAQEGISQIRQGIASWQASGAEVRQASFRAFLSEGYGKVDQMEDGLRVLAEGLEIANNTGERYYEAELYRLKGELTLAQSSVQGLESRVKEAEECFLKAIEIVRKQQAKSLELRATTSLSRLWQKQGKKKEAHEMLSEVYNWFTEGFDIKDLQEANALLEELKER